MIIFNMIIFNMIISIGKTQAMVIAKDPVRCKVVAGDNIIQQVTKFNYLGVETASDRNISREVRTQADKAARISGCLRDSIWRNLCTRSKVRIYRTCIRPILTYAAETREETSKTKKIIRTTEMKILRTIKGVTLREQIRSEAIRNKLEIQDIMRWTRARRRQWRDHVDRMGPERIARWAKIHGPSTTRLPGRPPKHWHESWTSGSQEVTEAE